LIDKAPTTARRAQYRHLSVAANAAKLRN